MSEFLDQFVARSMKRNGTPGAAIALTDRRRTLRVSTYGYSNITAKTPLSPNLLFHLASITKSFTCIALLQLHDEGKLDLHGPVKDYVPWFEVRSSHQPITIHHLMTHTAGIVGGTLSTPFARTDVWNLRRTEATMPPGAFFSYSDTGYNVLGMVLEGILGKSWGEIVTERIIKPLGMRTTKAAFTNEMRGQFAGGYAPLFDDRPHPRRGPLICRPIWEFDYACAAMASTPGDMAIYLRVLLNRGKGPRGRILSEESARLMTEPLVKTENPASWGGEYYGYGLRVGDVEGHRWIGHGGGAPTVGYLASMLADITEGVGVTVMTNGPAEPWDISHHALQAWLAARGGEVFRASPGPDKMSARKALDYVGVYRCGDRTLEVLAKGNHLFLRENRSMVKLEPSGPDAFYIPYPSKDRFLLRFGRQEERVVEAFHGSDWFVNDRYRGPREVTFPPEWATYVGHYASYNPVIPHFRIALRKGRLVLAEYLGDTETVLFPLPDGGFRLGEDVRSPERIRFDWIADGKALHADFSGGDYYRSFTP